MTKQIRSINTYYFSNLDRTYDYKNSNEIQFFWNKDCSDETQLSRDNELDIFIIIFNIFNDLEATY